MRIPGAGRRRFATPSYNQNFNLKLFLLIIVHAVKRMTLHLPRVYRRREQRANKPARRDACALARSLARRAIVLPVSSLRRLYILQRVSYATSLGSRVATLLDCFQAALPARENPNWLGASRNFAPWKSRSLVDAVFVLDYGKCGIFSAPVDPPSLLDQRY